MKTCPHCGYEKNSERTLMCGLCGKVFADMADRVVPARRLFRYRKDFAAEMRRNRWNSLALLLGFPLLIVGLGFSFDVWYGLEPYGTLGALAIAVALVLITTLAGDKSILSASLARPADKEVDQRLINVVDEMRIAAGLPMPRVYVMESDAANAFATGWDSDTASIAVTRGLVNALNREELQGVIGHEMSHVRNLDVRYMMLVATLVGAVVLLSDAFGRGLWWGRGLGRLGRSRDTKLNHPLLMLVALLFALLSPLIALMLQMAISRKREFLADASAVELTRNPLALASALEKIDNIAFDEPLHTANRATQHLFIVNPLRSYTTVSPALLSTHPPTSARIRILRAMAAEPAYAEA